MSRVAVVTYICTHYRYPLYRSIAGQHETEFFFTAAEARWYRPAAFGVDPSDLVVRQADGAPRLFRSLVRGQYDVIVTTLSGRATLVATYLAARVAGTPLVLWVGIWDHPRTVFHRISRPFTRFLYRAADAILVYGPHVAEHIERESGRTECVFEIRQAVDNDAFRRADPLVRSEGDGVRACFVGRLDPDKGVDVLLKALAHVPDLHLSIAGTGVEEGRLRELARALRISDRVDFMGFVAQTALPAKLREMDFLVLPSVTTRTQKEPWGLVANEAMNCGLPVIASTAVGAVNGGLIVHRRTGLIFPEGNATALAKALSALATNPQLRSELSERAREQVVHWNYAVAVEAFTRAVEAAISKDGPQRHSFAWR